MSNFAPINSSYTLDINTNLNVEHFSASQKKSEAVSSTKNQANNLCTNYKNDIKAINDQLEIDIKALRDTAESEIQNKKNTAIQNAKNICNPLKSKWGMNCSIPITNTDCSVSVTEPSCGNAAPSSKCSGKNNQYISTMKEHPVNTYCYNKNTCGHSMDCWKSSGVNNPGDQCNWTKSYSKYPTSSNGYQYHGYTGEPSSKTDYDEAYKVCANKCSNMSNCKGFNIASGSSDGTYGCNFDTGTVDGYPAAGQSNANPDDCWRNSPNQERKNKFCRFYKKEH